MRETRKTKPRRGGEPTLAELRQEIDRIDEAMHGLLIERGEIIWGTLPFVILMAIAVVILSLFPEIATGFPNLVMGKGR